MNKLMWLLVIFPAVSCTVSGANKPEPPTQVPTPLSTHIIPSPTVTEHAPTKTPMIPSPTVTAEIILDYPDNEIVFMSINRTERTEGIYSMIPDGNDITQIVEGNIRVAYPDCSQDGSQVLFSSNLDSEWEEMHIFIADREGEGYQQLTSSSFFESMPSISPSGNEIIYSAVEAMWTSYIIDSNGYSKRRWVNWDEDFQQPAWSPNADQIAFLSYSHHDEEWDEDIFHIYIGNLVGTEIYRVGKAEAIDVHAGGLGWSPDGTQIGYTGPDCNLNVVSLDGSGSFQITDLPGCQRNPSWSPDGKFIIFDSTDEKYTSVRGSDLLVVEIETLNTKMILDDPDPLWNSDPVWCLKP